MQPAETQVNVYQLRLRRVAHALVLIALLGLFLLWLPPISRYSLLTNLIANQFIIILLLTFGLTAISLLWSKGQAFDVWLFTRVNLHDDSHLWIDRLMWVATQMGNLVFAMIVALIVYGLGKHRFALGFALGSLTLSLLVTILKAITDRARPFDLIPDTHVIGWREPGLSFPSGHTAQTFFMMTFTILYFQLPIATSSILYPMAALVGVTRVYLGVHYPRDVIAGAVLGTIWGILCMLVSPYF